MSFQMIKYPLVRDFMENFAPLSTISVFIKALGHIQQGNEDNLKSWFKVSFPKFWPIY